LRKFSFDVEGSQINAFVRDWVDAHGITLCCAVLNEEENIEKFIEWHRPYVDNIVVIDGGSSDKTFIKAAKLTENIKIFKFNGHYGNQKNRAIESSLNDWVLFLDPDERLSISALKSLNGMINQDNVDCYSFPRKNYIDDAQDLSHGDDYQDRLFRAYCRYIRPVHEELVGFKNRFRLPPTSDVLIEHKKGSKRHTIRNNNYGYFDLINIQELGSPGSQTLESFNIRYSSVSTAISRMKQSIGRTTTL